MVRLVLRQIEQEDALWHSKQKAEKEKEKEKEQKLAMQEAEKKESASAVSDTTSENDAAKKTQPTRKVNFF